MKEEQVIIDTHTHLGRYSQGIVVPEMIIATMDEAGIDGAMIFAHEHQLPAQGITTEEIVEVSKRFPRLYGIGTASAFVFGSSRLDLLKGLLQDRAIRGIKFYVGYERYSPVDERLYPLYEVLSKESLPAIFHSGYFFDPERKGFLKYAHPLLLDEVAVAFPDLKIVIAHVGSPWIIDCGLVAERHPNIFLDVSGYFTEFSNPFRKEEKQAFREDIRRLHRLIGSYFKLLFATDWPVCDMGQYVAVAKTLPFSDEEKETFFWRNAAVLFQVEAIK